jgi:hypothetical protein
LTPFISFGVSTVAPDPDDPSRYTLKYTCEGQSGGLFLRYDEKGEIDPQASILSLHREPNMPIGLLVSDFALSKTIRGNLEDGTEIRINLPGARELNEGQETKGASGYVWPPESVVRDPSNRRGTLTFTPTKAS